MGAYRTVKWLPPVPGFFAVPPLQWIDKRPLDYEDFSLDMSAWLTDDADTVASVTCGTLQAGLQVGAASKAGSVVSTMLRAGIVGTTYSVGFVVTGASGCVIDVSVSVRCVAGLSAFPTSPVLLVPGATWFAAYRNSFQTVPAWSALPTAEPPNADLFWLNGGSVSIPSNTTLLPSGPSGLAVGDLWNDGGMVVCNGNPGLPTDASGSPDGTLVYNGGVLSLARSVAVAQSPILLSAGAAWFNSYRGAPAIVPVWAALPTSEPANADAFYLNGGSVLSIASNTTYLPSIPDGLPTGGIWNNGGTVMAAGNPGLPTSSATPGTLLYNGGALTLA